jgi:hypothetical protein
MALRWLSRETIMPATNIKLVYLNRLPIGSAVNWKDASLVLTARLDRRVSVAEAMKLGIEGPDGFYVTIRRLTLLNEPLVH